MSPQEKKLTDATVNVMRASHILRTLADDPDIDTRRSAALRAQARRLERVETVLCEQFRP